MKTVINFIKESVVEFKKVQWPTRKQTMRLTVFVIGASLIVGLYVSGLDLGFKKFLSFIVR
jgi:preprotein translocase subunit SecE